MSDLRDRLSALLREEFAQEAAAGFPNLRRVPGTRVIRFLDYLAGLDAAQQAALLDALAHFNAAAFLPELALSEAAARQQHPVFGNFLQAMAFRGFGGGYRYTPVKLLAGIAKDTAFGGIDGWVKQMGFTGLALQPRADLLPALACLKPVAPAKLRKLIDTGFTRLFDAQKTGTASDALRYTGILGTSRIIANLLFPAPGPTRPRQLQYLLSIFPVGGLPWHHANYEGLWSLQADWDYLTEENAPRSIGLLVELVAYLTALAGRVQALMNGAR